MSDEVEELVRTFPKSVQPGVPKLKAPQPGWRTVKFGDVLFPVMRPVRLDDGQSYRLVTVKRSRGGIEERGRMSGRQIAVKSQFEIEGGDFLISKRQIVHGACGVVTDEFAGAIVSNEYSVLRCSPELDLNFLRYLSHSVYFQQTCFHSSIGVHVEKMIFKLDEWLDWPVNLPTLPEQEKIAGFLGAVDGKISGLRRKEEGLNRFKAGLMQKLFSQELRFTRDDGSDFPDWQETRLSAVLLEHKGRSDGSEPVFSVSVHKGLVDQIEHLGRSFSAADTSHYNQVLPGDVVYTKSPTGDFAMGVIKQSKIDFPVIVSPLYGVFTPETPWLGRILDEYFASPVNTSNYLAPLVQKGAKNTIAVTNSRFLEGTLTLPRSPDEQRKIAEALSALDGKIAGVRDQIAGLETFKKGLLQQMFV